MFGGVYSSCLRKTCSRKSDSEPESEDNDEFSIEAPHKNEKSFYIDKFHSVKEAQTKMKFETRCPVMPSKWKVIIDLTINDVYESACLLITMMRTDSFQIPIEGTVKIWFLNSEGKTCPFSYGATKKMPLKDKSRSIHESCLVDDHFSCLFTEDHEEGFKILPKDMLVLKIQLFVKGCCDYSEETRNVSSGQEGTSGTHLEGEGTSRMPSGEGTSRMPSEEGTSGMHSKEDSRSMSCRSKL